MNYADKLRRFAEWLDQHPDFLEMVSEYDHPSLAFYYSQESKEQFGKMVAAIGSGDKSRYNDKITFRHDEKADPDSDGYSPRVFGIVVSISGVCEKKPTGEKKERKVYIPENAIQKEDGSWVVEDDVYEYDCPPLLSLVQSDD